MTTPTPPRKPRIRRVWKVLGGVLVLFIVANLGLLLLGSFARTPSGPGGSAYSTSIDGYQGWYELLSTYGRPTQRQGGPLDAAALDPTHTLIIGDSRSVLDEREIEAVKTFLEQGGWVVALGNSTQWVDPVVNDRVSWDQLGATTTEPQGATPITRGVTRITGAGVGSWSRLPLQAESLIGADGTTVGATIEVGRGELILIADVSIPSNRYLAATDNALFALRITGDDRPVDFAEGIHGYGEVEGINAIPTPWKLFGIGVILAGLILLVAKARRLGPPEETVRRTAPPRMLYVDALAQALASTHDPSDVALNVQDAVRRTVARRTGVPVDADPNALILAGNRLGVDMHEMQAAIEPIYTDEQLVLATRALARLSNEGGPQ